MISFKVNPSALSDTHAIAFIGYISRKFFRLFITFANVFVLVLMFTDGDKTSSHVGTYLPRCNSCCSKRYAEIFITFQTLCLNNVTRVFAKY